MTMTDEKVLCVTKLAVDMLLPLGWPHDKSLEFFLDENRRHYRWRKTENDGELPVEEDSRWKQLIPYIVCVNGDGQVLAYNRGWKGGEDRLKGRWAIGFGGHVNDKDMSFEGGIHREICEELEGFDCIFHVPPCDPKDNGGKDAFLYGPIGFIDDDSDDVGRHHLGVVYILRADEVVPRENPGFAWTDRPDLTVSGTLENWARLALPMVRAWMESEGK